MKKFIVFVMVIMFCGSVMAEDQDKYYTENAFNGTMWKALSENERFCYLRGIHESMKLVYQSARVPESGQPIDNLSQAITALYTPSGLTFNDIAEKIDGLYKESIDEKTPVFEVYALVCKENFALKVTENVEGTFDSVKLIEEVNKKYQ